VLPKLVLAVSIVLVGVLSTFDLRYSGLLGPKRQTSDARSPSERG
jgi:hypothetical protein